MLIFSSETRLIRETHADIQTRQYGAIFDFSRSVLFAELANATNYVQTP